MATRNGTPGNDTLTGTQFADSLFGFAGNDSLLGLSGNDSLNGGGGNDTLDGGNGIDILNGGVGNDTYIVDSTTDTITETANSGIDIVQSSVSYTLGSSLDNLTLTGTSAINGTGNSLNNTITGNDANNTLNGGAGNDILSGGSSGYGEFSGNDILYGGDGNDILFASNSYDRGSYSYTGEDILHGGNGNDTLNGGLANNTLDGGVGNDTYIIVNNIGVITESASSGIDVVESDGSYTLGSNLENLTLTGSFNSNGTGNSLNNTLIGNAASNFLNGLAGDDKLIGGAGNDILLGSSGTIGEKDTLTGGAGIDRFILGTVTQDFYDDRNKATAGTGDYALITDFNTNQDSIKLNGRRTDYLLAVSPTGLPAGIAIYRNKPAGERDELIAIVQGSSGLDLNGQYFQFTANEINLSTLNGSNGFVLKGIDANGQLGHSVSSAGDINGDGFDDVIIGAPYAEKSYVVFGKAGSFGTSINVSDLNGSNGFVINGAGGSFDLSGNSVSSAGDINGDGFSDLLLRARFADSYVVFGQGGNFSPSVNLSTLNGSNGFVISGIGFTGFAPKSVSSAGDINGDGFDDFLIGTNQGDPNGQSDAGKSYVVFGKIGGFSAAINVSELNGSNGFVINGIDEYDQSSWSVSSAGDINGDGFDDIIIGANGADSNGQERAGESYVVFGKAGGFSASLKLSDLNGSNGFVINGINAGDDSGFSVSSAGDVNGDGLDDIIIGARGAASNGEYGTGESYMVFGKVGSFGSSFNPSTLNGNNGFVINSIDNGDGIGFSVSSAGDINSDGLDDIIIGAPRSADNGQDGESYVVFGKEGGFGASINLSTLNGSNGFAINSINASINGDLAGWSVSSAGDVNGDGFDDLMVGAIQAGVGNAGESYVIFGRDFTNSVTQTGTEGNDTLSGTAGDDILVGGRGNDRLIGGMGVDVLYGGAGDDILSFGAIDRRLNGGSGTDTLRIDTSGITLDLRAIANNKITEFELIDLTGTGNNSLNFTRLDLLALSDTTNQLIINGNAGDTATSTGQEWTPGGTTTLNRILYDRYTIGAATLLVDADITQTIT